MSIAVSYFSFNIFPVASIFLGFDYYISSNVLLGGFFFSYSAMAYFSINKYVSAYYFSNA